MKEKIHQLKSLIHLHLETWQTTFLPVKEKTKPYMHSHAQTQTHTRTRTHTLLQQHFRRWLITLTVIVCVRAFKIVCFGRDKQKRDDEYFSFMKWEYWKGNTQPPELFISHKEPSTNPALRRKPNSTVK